MRSVSTAGRAADARFYPAVMRSAARLTYTRRTQRCSSETGAVQSLGSVVEQKLLPLVDVYRALLKARHRRGALDFDAPEAEFDIDDRGRIQRVRTALAQRGAQADRGVHDPRQRRGGAELERRQRRHAVSRARRAEEQKLDVLLEHADRARCRGGDTRENVTPRDLRAITERLGRLDPSGRSSSRW